jgi:hypothetical protein
LLGSDRLALDVGQLLHIADVFFQRRNARIRICECFFRGELIQRLSISIALDSRIRLIGSATVLLRHCGEGFVGFRQSL